MRRRLATLLIACTLLAAKQACAHRLDQYLQATILSIEPGRVSLTMRLVPGVAVAPDVIASIDRDSDGVLSAMEQQAYAERVLPDLLLEQDGRPLKLHVLSVSFPASAQMRAGTGEMTLKFAADLPLVAGNHQLSFQNHHRSGISVYLVNALVPEDPHLEIESQTRNRNQSFYQISFTESSAAIQRATPGFEWSGFGGAFRLGMRHIAEGTDHLLFLLTLLLPAPLLAYAGRWREAATVRRSLLHILGTVTAFTLGHSLTLALSALGLVQLPSRPVEIMIAVSILVSAMHALRPIFAGKEAAIAAFFGLIHGLAFASALHELGMTGWYRLVSLLGFNLGIEALQFIVVLVTLPSFLLLSRTPLYTPLRLVGAGLAAVAAIAWILERVTEHTNGFASLIEDVARRGIAIAGTLFVCSLLSLLSNGA